MSVCPVCYADSECMEICTCKSRNRRQSDRMIYKLIKLWPIVIGVVWGAILISQKAIEWLEGQDERVMAGIVDEMAKNIKENGRLEELVREKKPPERTWRAWLGTKHR